MTQTTTKKSYAPCYETHPPLPIGEHLIYGGSCVSPFVTNADVYVGLDHMMKRSPRQFPWEPGEEFLYPITDMGVPDAASLKKLVAWLTVQLTAKKLVHVGCIGGHGRTGLVFAALVAYMTDEKDAIAYVRKHYCHKAVESALQVRFLSEHFGILEAEPAKVRLAPAIKDGSWDSGGWMKGKPYQRDKYALPKLAVEAPGRGHYRLEPSLSPLSVWGNSVVFDKLENYDIIDLSKEG